MASSILNATTVLSLLSTVAILGAAYGASLGLLPRSSSSKTRLLFVWHAFDGLIHFILEGSYLYNCFFSYATVAGAASPYLPPNTYFLGHRDRVYGAAHGANPFAALWMEYARADARWGGSDLTIISLELLTVFGAGPLAMWICHGLRTRRADVWFWMVVLATAELYGGFMTFAPEWLTGNPNLDGSDFMLLWVYLIFFNAGLWVAIPIWVLCEAYAHIAAALRRESKTAAGKKRK